MPEGLLAVDRVVAELPVVADDLVRPNEVAIRCAPAEFTAECVGETPLDMEVMSLPLRQLKRKRLDPMVKRAYDSGEETVFKTRFQWALIPAMLLLLLELFWIGGSRR